MPFDEYFKVIYPAILGWNNPRDAVGMYLWGQRTKDEKLLERARRIVNLAMLARARTACSPASTTWTGRSGSRANR